MARHIISSKQRNGISKAARGMAGGEGGRRHQTYQ